jgi:hypothetical protein
MSGLKPIRFEIDQLQVTSLGGNSETWQPRFTPLATTSNRQRHFAPPLISFVNFVKQPSVVHTPPIKMSRYFWADRLESYGSFVTLIFQEHLYSLLREHRADPRSGIRLRG